MDIAFLRQRRGGADFPPWRIPEVMADQKLAPQRRVAATVDQYVYHFPSRSGYVFSYRADRLMDAEETMVNSSATALSDHTPISLRTD
jgi:hypothetical protein